MKLLAFAALLLAMAGTGAAAMDADAEALARGYKGGKAVAIGDVATLMRLSERWCYDEQQGSCAWSDIYLEVTDAGATYEITSLWDADREITLTDEGTFRDGRFICETSADNTPTLRARTVADGTEIGGRDLWALKGEVAAQAAANPQSPDICYDYVFVGLSLPDDTINLTQRIWRSGATDPTEDAVVTLHFDAQKAAVLTTRW
jgi:hypothetical protein